jgi:hypothetical protein
MRENQNRKKITKTVYTEKFIPCPKCGGYNTGPLEKSYIYWGCDDCGTTWWPTLEKTLKAIEELVKLNEN